MNFQDAIYMPNRSRTEMLSTDPGSKFRGASFLFQQVLGPKIEFWVPKSEFWC